MNPAMWIGAFAVAIPLLVHILTRRTPRELIFPTLKFIYDARASQSSLFRLRHWILYAVRTLLVIFILAVFLKPILNSPLEFAQKDKKSGKTVVIIMDVSASMGYSPAGASRFSQARLAANKIVDHLDAPDIANLILMGAVPRISFDEPGRNFAVLRKDIQQAKQTQERADVNAAVARAVKQLAGAGNTGVKSIHVISDFQRSNWSAVDFSVIPQQVQLVLIQAASDAAENTAITEVSIQPACPTVFENVRVIAKVANYSDSPKSIKLEMAVRNGNIFTEKLELEAQATGHADFMLRPSAEGNYQCRLNIPSDGLKVDDSRFFTFKVTGKIDILIVSDEAYGDQKAAKLFLARAVNPFLLKEQSTAEVKVISTDELNKVNLSTAQMVILTGINELSREMGREVVEYLNNGGSVVYFHVRRAGGHNLKLLTEVSNGALKVPYKLISQVDHSQKGEFSCFANANFDHPVLKKFKEAGELGDIQFYRYFATERIKQTGSVLLQYDDGNIAMASRTVGAGNILLCNFDCSLDCGDIARHTLFVPIVHEIIKYMRPDSAVCNSFEVGRQCSLALERVGMNSEFEFSDPAGKSINGNIQVSESEAVVFFPTALQCGFYSVSVDKKIAGAVAVNVNSLESNLEILTNEQLAELSKIPGKPFAASIASSSDLEDMLEIKHLWHYFLIIAVFVMAVEHLLTIMVCR